MGVGSEVMGEHLARAVAEKRWNRTSMVFRVPPATAEAAVGATAVVQVGKAGAVLRTEWGVPVCLQVEPRVPARVPH